MLVESFLETTAERLPDKTALVCGRRRLSYAELETDSNRLAHALRAAGVRRGDRVAIYLGNSVEAVIGLFATLKAGAAFMMINPTAKAEKLGYLLEDSRARAILLPARKWPACRQVLAGAKHVHAVITTGTDSSGLKEQGAVPMDELLQRHANDTSPPVKQAIDLDLAGLLYTSGSTGTPKGVMATHRNVMSAATSIISYLENTSDDVILNVLPMSFGYGCTRF